MKNLCGVVVGLNTETAKSVNGAIRLKPGKRVIGEVRNHDTLALLNSLNAGSTNKPWRKGDRNHD